MYEFNAAKEKEHIINWIKTWFDDNGKYCKAIIGISGGKDSTIIAALLKEALGADRVLGVLMPNGEQADIEDSFKVVKYLKIPYTVVNIKEANSAILSGVKNAISEVHIPTGPDVSDIKDYMIVSEQTVQNLPPRLRMSTLYAISQSIDGRVVNTSNLSEVFIGYGTRWADTVGDMCPFKEYTVTEVYQIGDLCDLPKELVHKTPSDGLCGKTDEDRFGFTYEVLDKYIRGLETPEKDVLEKIVKMHDKNVFKGKMPEVCHSFLEKEV